MDQPVTDADTVEALTPMMRQYHELKRQAGDAILFFRMGDFYEIFGDDAEQVAPVLELVLTSREKGDQTRIPFCGVPHHSARNYWLKLLKRGYKVALADQTEDPAQAKGLVRREIIRVLTPGCVDDLEGLERDSPNYLMALHEDPESKAWAALLADVSTGELRLGSVAGLAGARALVERFRPKELLARQFFHEELASLLARQMAESRTLVEPLPEAPLRDKGQQKQILHEVFGKQDLASQPCGEVPGGEALVCALIVRLRSMQASVSQFLSIRPMQESGTMMLDESAIRDLELFETARRRQSEGSLYKEINRTLSPMGARLLRFFLASPLMDRDQIRARHAAVRSLLRLGETRLAELRGHLKSLPDLERLATRIFAAVASPAELQKARQTLERAHWIVDQLTGERGEKLEADLFAAIATGLKFCKQPLRILTEALEESPRALGTGCGVFRAGYDAELDKLSELARSGERRIEEYQEALKARTGIGSLKIKNHQSFGLLIEVTRANVSKVPPDFIRRQTMVNNERFVTVELQELDESLASAQQRAVEREQQLFQQLLVELLRFRMDIRSVAQAIATFDMLQAFAWQALKHDWCEPRIADDDVLELKGSRHPVVERFVGRHAFAPNDITMSPKKKHLLITGPNMAGKSTVMRQTAIAAILAQIGSFVPATSARLPVFDRIFTRVGAADDLSRGQSTFMVEMSEAANILRHATQKSLVILDEVGRGTSTQDGLAIATAIFMDLVGRVRCYTMFATHYHELVPHTEALATVSVVQTEVMEQNGRVIFTHRLKPGASGSSFGIEVARIAGLPEPVIAAALEHLAQSQDAAAPAAPAGRPRRVEGATGGVQQPALARFGVQEQSRGALERLARLDLNRLTPIQALNFLAEIQQSLMPVKQPRLFPEETS
jgi:DNA mismatch repair protein MutS